MNKFRSFKELNTALLNNNITCRTIVQHYLKKIEENKSLNAFVEVFAEEALQRAKLIDKKIKSGSAGRLAGMVVGIKDNICYKDHKVTASSKILQGFKSIYSATVVTRLIDQDAIIIGSLNCDEFAMGSTNENSVYGAVKNPLNKNKVAGGSSGGSAAAVSAGLCLVALGSDTGGSIRQPASFCGVVGLKPTYSRVSRHGLIAYASSFDQIGPLSNNIDDAALVLEIISGKDDFDGTVSTKEVDQYSNIHTYKNTRKIGYIAECLENKNLDKEIRLALKERIEALKKEGNIVEPVSFPYLNLLVPTYYVITTAEASSNLARFDGIHYGYRSKNAEDLQNTYFKSRTEGFGKEVKRRIMLGTFVLSSGYHEAYFTQAQKIRKIIQEATNEMFKKYQFILSPTTPHTAFDIGNKYSNPTTIYLEDIFTVHANLTGNPAISIPLGRHSNGMPMGMQLMANHFEESALLEFSNQLFLKE